MRFFEWQNMYQLIGKSFVGTVIGSAGLCLGVGAYGAKKINHPRERWFTDNFVLTPETLRLPYKTVNITTEDGIELDAWWIEQTIRGKPSSNVVLGLCPFNHNKSTLLGVARGLWDHGFSVLLFDFRSFAKKQTKETIGYYEKRDGDAALDWLCANKPEGAKIAIVGASMGGAVSLMLAAENRPEVVACATDCAFASLKDVIAVGIDQLFFTTRLFGTQSPIPLHKLFVESICLVNKIWYGYDPADVGPRKCLDHIKVPLFILHSELDSVVPVEHGFEIFEKSATPPENKTFFVVKGLEHIGSFFEDQKEYTRRIATFFDQSFARSSQVPVNYSQVNPQEGGKIEATALKSKPSGGEAVDTVL